MNQRFAFYWRLSFFVISGFTAMANQAADMIERRNTGWLAIDAGYCILGVLCFGTFILKPSHFGQDNLLSATEVTLRRTDVSARLVSEFPPEARYGLDFKKRV
jgi:hypothetical protein